MNSGNKSTLEMPRKAPNTPNPHDLGNVPDFIITYDHEGQPLRGNVAWEKLIGREKLECSGESQMSSTTLEIWNEYHRLLQRAIEGIPSEMSAAHLRSQNKTYNIIFLPNLDKDADSAAIVIVRDISKIASPEDNLHGSDKYFRYIAKLSQNPLLLFNTSGHIAYVNPALEKLLSTSLSDVVGKTLPEIPGLSGSSPFLSKILNVARTGLVERFEQSLTIGTKEHFWEINPLAPIKDKNERVVSVLAVIKDITEQSRIERTLHFIAGHTDVNTDGGFLSALARHLGKTLNMAYVVIDRLAEEPGIAETVGLYANGAIVPNMRYPLAGTPCQNVFHDHTCSYPRGVQALFPEDKLLADMGVESYAGTPLRDSTGKVIGLIAVMDTEAFQNASAVCHLLQIVATRASAELERAESDSKLHKQNEFQKTLLDAINDVGLQVMVIENGLIIHASNRKLVRDFGYDDDDLAAGVPLLDIIHPDDRPRVMDHHARRLAGDKDVPNYYELSLVTKSGERREYETSLTSIPDTTPLRIISVGRDITERNRAESELRHLQQAINRSADGLLVMDDQFRFIRVNDTTCRMLGYSREELLGMTPLDIDLNITLETLQQRAATTGLNEPYTFESLLRSKNGRIIPAEISGNLFLDGAKLYRVVMMRDISTRTKLQEDLRQREHQYRTLVENSPDLICRYDRDCRRTFVNPAFATVVETRMEDLVGKSPSEFPGKPYSDVIEQHVQTVFLTGEQRDFEVEWVNESQKTIYCLARLTPEFGINEAVESVLGIYRDITELHLSRQKIYQMAFYDRLTGLPNRALLNDRLQQMINDAARHDQRAGILLIDIDRFKSVNDTMGHGVGDQLLCEVARRLTDRIRSYDTVARLGGDEFVILMPDIRDGADLGHIAGKILDTINQPFHVQNSEIFISCSIGIAAYPHDGDTEKDLLRYADSAMYFAKRSGRNDFRFYSKELTDSASRRLSIETGLRHAIERNEMEVHFQPKVSLTTGEVIGSEALLRWNTPQLGAVPPDHFIPVAEDTGMIVEIGEWVLRESCKTARDWNADGMPPHKIAVNLSGRQFQTRNLVETVSDILMETGCRPEWLELEITESLLLDKDGNVADMLTDFQSMGITIAIDDFGTGYSSLSYLANYSIDTLKIDKSFVQAITTDRRRAELVKAILSIADCLGQKVVAEGVETPEQALFLKNNNCHFAQGWHYGRPVPKAMFRHAHRSCHELASLE